jgi:hypothetical protein
MAESHLARFEVKNDPRGAPSTKIVEAYGLGKCPKLVSQISGSDLDVRINALAVLCDEFKNPYSIEGCVREGVVSILAQMITDPDYTTRVRASHALELAAKDANGFFAILLDQDEVLPKIVIGVQDPSETVREHIYNCLLSTTRTQQGIEACVKHGVVTAFVGVLPKEMDSLKAPMLKTLHNIVGNELGLEQALDTNAVGVLIDHLSRKDSPSDEESSIITEAARALGFMCFDGKAKKQALEKGAVAKLVSVLREKELSTSLKIALTIALTAITITNDGKKQVFQFEGLDIIMELLYDDSRAVVLNALKIISNLAVYPQNREIFATDSTCTVKLRKLCKAEDALISKHANIALNAVNWTP